MVEASPFDLAPDPEGDKNALTKALQIVKGFALYFVVSEVSRVRPRLMDEIEARFPGKTIQRIYITKETTNLLHTLQEQLQDPLPDIVFVSGFENVISAAAQPRSHPLLLNINATRNNFYALLPRPVVLWVPPFALRTIAQAAPDFVSVRSGVYTFALSPEEQWQITRLVSSIGQTEILGMKQAERDNHIFEVQNLLADLRSRPMQDRNQYDESLLLNQLGVAYLSLSNHSEAESTLQEALLLRRGTSEPSHNTATIINNLSALYAEQDRYEEAKSLAVEALAIHRDLPMINYFEIVPILNNLASIHVMQSNYKEAEPLYIEALNIRRDTLPSNHPDVARSLSNLASLYEVQHRYAEAESLYTEALFIRRSSLPFGHPSTGTVLGKLASVYIKQDRYNEAESLLMESLYIYRDGFPNGHSDIPVILSNLADLYVLQERYNEAGLLYNEALAMCQLRLGMEHPLTIRVKNSINSLHKVGTAKEMDVD